MKALLDHLLQVALTILVTVLLLSWAWRLLLPLLPVIIGAAAAVVVTTAYVRHRRSW